MESRKLTQEIAKIFPNVMKTKNTDTISSSNSNQNNTRKLTTRSIVIKLLKFSGKDKVLKSKQTRHCIEEIKDKNNYQFLTRNIVSKKMCLAEILYSAKILTKIEMQ